MGSEQLGLENDEFLDDESNEEISAVEMDATRPTLLFYEGRIPSKQELIADLPEREVVDRLIAKFFNSDDPSLGQLSSCLSTLVYIFAD